MISMATIMAQISSALAPKHAAHPWPTVFPIRCVLVETSLFGPLVQSTHGTIAHVRRSVHLVNKHLVP